MLQKNCTFLNGWLPLPKQHIRSAYQSNPLKPKRCSIHHPPGVHCSIATFRPFTFEFHIMHIIVAWHISFIVYLLCFFLVLISTLHLLAVANRAIQILQMINYSDPIAEIFKLMENRPPCPSNFLSSPFPSCESCQMPLMSEKEKI